MNLHLQLLYINKLCQNNKFLSLCGDNFVINTVALFNSWLIINNVVLG